MKITQLMIVILVCVVTSSCCAPQSKLSYVDVKNEELEPSRGMALLAWFPRVKTKMLRSYGAQKLATVSLRAMERLINNSKQADRLTPSDFLELDRRYTEQSVEDALAIMYARFADYKGDILVKRAIEQQLKDAEWAAYESLRALENPQSFRHSFYIGGHV